MRWLMVLVFLATLGVACGSSSEPATQVPTVIPTQTPTDVPVETSTDVPAETETRSGSYSYGVNMADETITTASGLQIKTIVVGTGDKAEVGKTAVVHYTGWLLDGTKFDSSVDRGTLFEFSLGQGRVIKGWDEGVATMNIGGKVELIIPPDLGYGASGAGGVIPPNATLKFEIEFLDQK